ncbi:hypothetical protein DL764_002599 [Monosporascus ibericus]|uniref:Nephrocystin 3-like N-terminal domain-containing protein n=1 Tax=Monosporascus ibericus TaxID=155417 RepID=A0A4Q4TM94_9PEZI|nr:hypothetical protein DL764_002599 [Monosporascus ibericus]
MEGLASAASVGAIVDLSAKVASLCFRYSTAVKNAKTDIERVRGEVDRLKTILERAQRLLDSPNGARLQTSQPLSAGLDDCASQLAKLEEKLEEKLNPGTARKRMSAFGIRALKWPFESKDVDDIIQDLNKSRDMLSTSLMIDQTALLLDDERLKILEWISPIPYGKHHSTVKKARTSGTCEWLLQHERFREWEDTTSSVILWLQGSPGAGKTFLTSKVIDYVQSLLKGPRNGEGFAFFYCNRNEEERRKPLMVLRSYVRQLSTTARCPEEKRKKLQELWSERRLGGSALDLEDCREQLFELVNLYPRTTLVLDALDECEPDLRGELVNTVEILLSKSRRPLKVFISSRPDRDIRNRFLDRPNIEIQATHNETDIQKFVDEEIINHGAWEDISPQLKEEILRTLLARSQGMFQWVFLGIKQLLELETEAAIRDRLGRLPTGLKATYDEIYSKIEARHKHDKTLADRAFMWVMCAREPLSSEVLLSAIRPDSERDAFHLSEGITESRLLHLCNNLLVLDSQRKIWRFSHLSVTEYFEENHWGLWQAHCLAAKVCLKLLIEICEEPKSGGVSTADENGHKSKARDTFRPDHPLQVYSLHHWIAHVQTQEGQTADPVLAGLLKKFLGSPEESSVQYREWHRQVLSGTRFVFGKNRDNPIYVRDMSPANATILVICRCSFYTLLSDWWANAEVSLLQKNDEGNDLLTLAAVAGCIPICEALIKRGMQVNMQSGIYGSALAAAAFKGETETVKFLVQKGAEINMPLQTGNYGSALAAAAFKGETETVKFLVHKGAEVNMPLQTGYYGSVLAAAAYQGEIEIVKFLVEKGAEVNMPLQTGEYGSALAAATAAYKGIEIVKFLVQKGAEVNMPLQTGKYGSALAIATAAYKGIEIVKFLVEKGAEVNMPLQTGEYGSALAIATAAYEGIEIVKFLVEKGAEVNMPLQTGEYGSALAAATAAYKGIEIVKFLVQKGAEVNMPFQTGRYGSALVAAAFRGETKTVKFLVQKGAKVNMPLQTGYYGSALAAAAYNGRTGVVKFLVQEGRADANMQLQVGLFGSALAAAAYWGWKGCTEILIDGGAKVNLRLENGPFGTALQASRADISREDRQQQPWWDGRDEEEIKRDKAEVAEMLQHCGAIYED